MGSTIEKISNKMKRDGSLTKLLQKKCSSVGRGQNLLISSASLNPMLYGLFIPYLEGHVRFPAIKTHSVPNLLARSSASGEQPMKTEKSNSAGARITRESRNKR